ncbi:toxin HicA [Thioalkalivibrio sp.]|uniref:toxin HicA n=1 Tax=Thioalkalivibrio sp. TaxID=2093813 RepID=UPI003976974F
MATIRKIIKQMRTEPGNARFTDLRKVCEEYFGPPRQRGTRHLILQTPWVGDPRINIQRAGDKAKPYQVRQGLKALEKLDEQT